MIFLLKILLDIIFSGYDPHRVPFYFVMNISCFVHIRPPADYRGKSGAERSPSVWRLGKVFSQGTLMPNMKALSLTVKSYTQC